MMDNIRTKNLLILTLTDLSNNPRPRRQIKLLKDEFFITTVGRKSSGLEDEFILYKKESILCGIIKLPLLWVKNYKGYYWSKNKREVIKSLSKRKFDIIIAHDERSLPIAQQISNGARIILDAHEYQPEEHDGSLIGKLQKAYVNHFYTDLIKAPDAMFTVCESIAQKYLEVLNVKSEVIRNMPNYLDLLLNRSAVLLKLYIMALQLP